MSERHYERYWAAEGWPIDESTWLEPKVLRTGFYQCSGTTKMVFMHNGEIWDFYCTEKMPFHHAGLPHPDGPRSYQLKDIEIREDDPAEEFNRCAHVLEHGEVIAKYRPVSQEARAMRLTIGAIGESES